MNISGIAVIIGGASGIGAACSRYFASKGADVVIADRNLEAANLLANETRCRAYEVDVTSEAVVQQCAARIERDIGPVHSLINCAGLLQGPSRPLEMSMLRWDEVTNVDQRGTFMTCIAFGAAMVNRGRGSIVNVASVAGMRSLPLHAYAPAKAAVISMTECLAAEWGPAGVRVNCVSPGFTRTPTLQNAIDLNGFNTESMTSGAALGRLVEPTEIAKAVAFLCSDDAAAISGVNLPVDCGWLAGSAWSVFGGLRAPS